MTLLIPFSEGQVINQLHKLQAVKQVEYLANGTQIKVKLPLSEKEFFSKYEMKE